MFRKGDFVMTNPMFSPQPNYSGVTIQITNPAVNVCPNDGKNTPCLNNGCYSVYPNVSTGNQSNYVTYPQAVNTQTAGSVSNPNQKQHFPYFS